MAKIDTKRIMEAGDLDASRPRRNAVDEQTMLGALKAVSAAFAPVPDDVLASRLDLARGLDGSTLIRGASFADSARTPAGDGVVGGHIDRAEVRVTLLGESHLRTERKALEDAADLAERNHRQAVRRASAEGVEPPAAPPRLPDRDPATPGPREALLLRVAVVDGRAEVRSPDWSVPAPGTPQAEVNAMLARPRVQERNQERAPDRAREPAPGPASRAEPASRSEPAREAVPAPTATRPAAAKDDRGDLKFWVGRSELAAIAGQPRSPEADPLPSDPRMDRALALLAPAIRQPEFELRGTRLEPTGKVLGGAAGAAELLRGFGPGAKRGLHVDSSLASTIPGAAEALADARAVHADRDVRPKAKAAPARSAGIDR